MTTFLQGAMILAVIIYLGRYLRGRSEHTGANSEDQRDARDADVKDLVSSALGSRKRRRKAPAAEAKE